MIRFNVPRVISLDLKLALTALFFLGGSLPCYSETARRGGDLSEEKTTTEEGRKSLVAELEWRTRSQQVISQWEEAALEEGREVRSRSLVNFTVEGVSDVSFEENGGGASFYSSNHPPSAFIKLLSVLDRRLSPWLVRFGYSRLTQDSVKPMTMQADGGRSDYVAREIVYESFPFRMSARRNGGVADRGTELLLDYGVSPQLRNNVCIRLNMKTLKGEPVLVLLGDFIKTLEIRSVFASNNFDPTAENNFQLNQGNTIKDCEWHQQEKGKFIVYNGKMNVGVNDMTHLDILGDPNIVDLSCVIDLEVNGRPVQLHNKGSDFLRVDFQNHSTFRLGLREVLQRKFGIIKRATLFGIRIALLKGAGEPSEDRKGLLGVNILVPRLARSHVGGNSPALFTGGLTLSGNSEPPYRESANWDELRRVGLDINNSFDGDIVVTRKADALAVRPKIYRLFICGWGDKPVIVIAGHLSRKLQEWGGLYFFDTAFRREALVPQVDYFMPDIRALPEPVVSYFNASSDKGDNDYSMRMLHSDNNGKRAQSIDELEKSFSAGGGSDAKEMGLSFESNHSFPVGRPEFFYWGIPQDIEGLVSAELQAEGEGGTWRKIVGPNRRILVPDWLAKIKRWSLLVTVKDSGGMGPLNSIEPRTLYESLKNGEIIFYRVVKIPENSAIEWPRPLSVVDHLKLDLLPPFPKSGTGKNNGAPVRRKGRREIMYRSIVPDYLYSESLDVEYSLSSEGRDPSGCWLTAEMTTEKNQYKKVICTESNVGKINIPISSLMSGGNKDKRFERITRIDWKVDLGKNSTVAPSLFKVYFRGVRNVSPLEESSYSPVATVDNRLFYADLKSAFNQGNVSAADVPLSESPTDFSKGGDYSANVWEGIHPLLNVKKIDFSSPKTKLEPPVLPSVGRIKTGTNSGLTFNLIFSLGYLLLFLFVFRSMSLKGVQGFVKLSQLCPPYLGFAICGGAFLMLFVGYVKRAGETGDWLISVASILIPFGLWLVVKWLQGRQLNRSGFLRLCWSDSFPKVGWILILLSGAVLLSIKVHGGSEFLIDSFYFVSVYYCIKALSCFAP